MDLITHIPGVGPTASFNPGATTPAPYNVPQVGALDGTGPGTATKNVAELYNRDLLWRRALIAAAGLAFDPTNWIQEVQAISQLASNIAVGNVTTINFAASPFALTASHAGMVLVDAAAGNVVINLPAANLLAGLRYEFRRIDATANTVTINRAGADTIDEGGTSFTLTSKAVQNVRSNGASTWSSVTPVAASQAETDAGTNDSKFVTAKKLRFGFAALIAATGYIAFPSWMGSLILQWGNTTSSAVADTPVVYPLAFTTATHLILGSSPFASQMTFCPVVGSQTTTGFSFNALSSGGRNAIPNYWFSLGK